MLSVNAAIVYALVKRNARGALVSLAAVALVALTVFAAVLSEAPPVACDSNTSVVAVQPNVIPDFNRGEAITTLSAVATSS